MSAIMIGENRELRHFEEGSCYPGSQAGESNVTVPEGPAMSKVLERASCTELVKRYSVALLSTIGTNHGD